MSLLTKRIRGVRVLDMIALGLLISLILSVYLAKTIAGRERTEIASVERQIGAEHERIRLLQAEVSHLERPARIEQLSVSYLGLGPINAKHETTPEALAEVVRMPSVKAPVIPASQPAPVQEAAASPSPPTVQPAATASPAQTIAAQPVSVPPHLVPPTLPKRPAL
jgi:cell division protein FtsL